jgi:hypothetical protein
MTVQRTITSSFALTIVVDADSRTQCEEDTQPLNPVIEFLPKNKVSYERATYHDGRLPHDACPHEALVPEAADQEKEDHEPGYDTGSQVVVVAILSEPLEMGISKQLAQGHCEDVDKRHLLLEI